MKLKQLMYGCLFFGLTSYAIAQEKPKQESHLPQSYKVSGLEQEIQKTYTKKIQVIDSTTNTPLPEANILFGKDKGAATDINGYATLSADKDTIYTIRASYIGYNKQEQDVRLDNNDEIIKIFLKPTTIESSQVTVIAKKEETLDEMLRTRENITPESMLNTQLITGTATEQMYAQMTGSTTTPGKEFHFSSAGDEVMLKYHGIPMKTSDFFDISGVLYSEDTEMNGIEFAPPPDKEGMQVNIDARMKKPEQGLGATVFLNHVRGSIGLSGTDNILFNNPTWFALNYEGNISELYLNDIKPRNNKYKAVASTEWKNSSLTMAAIHRNTAISMVHNDRSPSINDMQTGASLEYDVLGSNSELKILYVFNELGKRHWLKDFLTSNQNEMMHEFRAELTRENPMGMLTTGIDAKHIRYSQDIIVEGDKTIYNELLKEKIVPQKNSGITPINLFFNQEIGIDKETALALGSGMLFDMENIRKGFAFGPYAKFTTKISDVKLTFTGRQSFSYVGLKPYSDDIDIKEYSASAYPKSVQLKLEMNINPFSAGILYYNFYNQPKNDININPIEKIFTTYDKEMNRDSIKAAIILKHPEIIYDTESLQGLDSLLNFMTEEKQIIYSDINDYGTNYYSNPNRYGYVAFASFRTDNVYLSATLSKTMELGTQVPYANDIALILKGHTYFNLGKSFTLSAYVEYSTGRPYTGATLMPSISEEEGLQKSLEQFKNDIPTQYYSLLSEQRKVSQDRNSERYPPNIISSLSLTWHVPNLPLGMDMRLRAYANNIHNIFNLIKENTYQIYQTITPEGTLVTKEGKGIGFAPGIDLIISIPISGH
jgi:hypothetical protein